MAHSSPSPLPEASTLTLDSVIDLNTLYPPLAKYVPATIRPSLPQATFLLTDAREAFYGGAAGGGKSAALLMAALQHVDTSGYHALILRRTYVQLSKGDALIPLSHEWLSDSDARWNEQKKLWTFPSGATIEFGHVETENSKFDYQGAAYQFIGFDELTQFTESQYEYIAFSRQRRRTDIDHVPIRVRATANPGGIGHGWVKRRFITHRRPGVVFVPAKVSDNPGLDVADYSMSLAQLAPELRRQLLDGDWDAFEGAGYPMFDKQLHLVDEFPVPDSFERWESMDHGVQNPTAWLLWCTDYDGNIICLDEYYAPGLPGVHAAEIKARRGDWWQAKDDAGWPVTQTCWGDPMSLAESLPTANQFGRPETLLEIYQQLGVRIVPANNRRRAGYVRIAELLTPNPARMFPLWHPRAGESGAPRLFVVGSRCPHLVEQLLAAPVASEETDPERGTAIDRKWESQHGHAHAAARYGLTTRPSASEEPPRSEADERKAHALRMLAQLDEQVDYIDV